ncbi:unnamed protein product [Zymoseptoria tritici ST99CH_3D1]|nr:unnamed protein product [Zymoseptoria tritici ST99CH_3D1]
MAKNKQKGRAGAKKKAQKAFRQPPRDYDDDDFEQSPFKPFKGFAGSAPPRNGASSFTANVKFREQAIAFVSAGTNAPPTQLRHTTDATPPPPYTSNDDDEDEEMDDLSDVAEDNIEINIVTSTTIEESEDRMADLNIHNATEEMEVDEAPTEPMFVVDTVGDSSLESKMANSKRAARRAPSPIPSDSDDEVVVFSGRNKRAVIIDDAPIAVASPAPGKTPASARTPALPVAPTNVKATAPQPPVEEAPHMTDDLLRALAGGTEPIKSAKEAPTYMGWASQPSVHDQTVRPAGEWTPAPDVPYWRKHNKKPRPDLGPSESEIKAFEEAPQKDSKVRFVQADNSETSKDTADDVATAKADWKYTLKEKKAAKGKASMRERLPHLVVVGQQADVSSVSTVDPYAAEISVKDAGPSRRAGKKGRKKSNRAMRKAIDSDDNDTDGEAAYDDYMENLAAGLDDDDVGNGSEVEISAFEARSVGLGPSMVVNGKAIADDEVLPKYMRSEGEDHESDWESDSSDALNPDSDELSSEEDLNASDLEDELEYTEKQMWEDELDIRQRRIERMTDEQIARLFAKQEELGMTGDELLIDDGAFTYTSDEGFGDITAARAGLSEITNSAFGKRSARCSGGDKKFNFPNATALADTVEQYGENGFDIMDMERPSLRPTRKGRKGKLPDVLDTISDDELKANLNDAWQKDRFKKSQKKLEREELRREGLLGSAGRKGKPDLNAKYPLGMTMRQVADELRDFLQNDSMMTRSFPSMAKSDRAALHTIATAFNLNSKSQGSGKNRFPILAKTARTQPYSPDVFERVMAVSEKGFLTNGKAKKLAKGGAVPGGPGGRGKGGFSKSAVGVRNGEIVGAGAAEIGQESMGHRLMLKMGWSKGMGLGKDGEGSQAPIEQKIRLGTAGLG